LRTNTTTPVKDPHLMRVLRFNMSLWTIHTLIQMSTNSIGFNPIKPTTLGQPCLSIDYVVASRIIALLYDIKLSVHRSPLIHNNKCIQNANANYSISLKSDNFCPNNLYTLQNI
jgi:hypothetical protein